MYDSWVELGIISVTSRTRIIFAVCKKVIKKILKTADPFHFQKLDYKIYTTILASQMRKTLDTKISENQSAAVKDKTIFYTLSTICDMIEVSKLNSNFSK